MTTQPHDDPCAHCEEMMQPYLDHILTEAERVEAELHLDECDWCRRRYRFEESLRVYVRQAVNEPMSASLKQKLAALRIPLN
jgi:predicted anti-sigma-YlaC factor YlaD